MKTRLISVVIISMVVALLFPPLTHAEEPTSGSEKWEFTILPYLWMAGLEGDVVVKGTTSAVDASFGDILDNLDFAYQLHLEAKKGKWAFFIDPTYMKISVDESATTPLGATVDAELTSETWLVEGGVFYRIDERAIGDDGVRTLAIDLLGGVRYNNLKSETDIKGSEGMLDIDADGTKDWVDPIVGGRIQARLTEKLIVNLRGDIGGFDISGSSDFAWNVLAALGYNLRENVTLMVGYRALGVDYDDGNGDDRFEYDVTMSGPYVGMAYRF
ncbi:MAG: hypothetical protein C4532_16160 [Candidatus Abyssobacteria bacterium SURF_17]|uniref:Outer membrane protein beta-barrel domain-containing protein n=1 Tax=Candidatus Abyssobacteria bacterium SURF_17 TaxID=2093361 RepID=A0A419ESA2_9BACT|nr:MAG: hypothetical protein C4532_16160 [Candidatus Abyssubacteria bacterium SURF_17]